MKTKRLEQNSGRGLISGRAGFTLVEVLIGIGLLGIMSVSLYAGFAFAFAEIRRAQENVRATQILEERMEVIRVLNWDQVVNLPGYIPARFTAPFASDRQTNASSGSFEYSGTVLVTNAPLTESYANDLRMIQIQLSWPSGKGIRQRQMTTFVSQYGMQKHLY